MQSKLKYSEPKKKHSLYMMCRNGDQTILDSISFDFHTNRTLVILGPGGSGKSTLLNILSGNNLAPLKVVNDMHPLLDKEEVGHMEQKNLYLHTTFKEIFNDHEESLVNAVLSIWDDSNLIKELLHYSTILKTKIPKRIYKLFEFTLFFSMERYKSVWLIDEPDVDLHENLDYLIDALKGFKKDRTIILVTHNVMLARAVADDILFLVYGQIVEHSPAHEFLESTNPDVQYLLKYGR